MQEAVPDILEGYGAESITLAPDRTGPLTATLVSRAANEPTDKAVLYVHGYNDYFFCEEMGPRFNKAGFHFYSLDLRRYGRSWRSGQTLAFTTDLGEYFEEIDAAIQRIRQRDGRRHILLHGHSTGGLICALHASARGGVDALLLNSPFFAFRATRQVKLMLRTITRVIGRIRPMHDLDVRPDPRYAWSMHERYGKGGEWTYDEAWKLPGDLPLRAGWVRAVAKGHAEVRRGLGVAIPTLAMASAKRGGDAPGFSRGWMRADTVLDPDHCLRGASFIGPNVHSCRIDKGMHDLLLSRAVVRDTVYEEIFAWHGRL